MPPTVTEIAEEAFEGCTSLGIVELCEGLRILRYHAFGVFVFGTSRFPTSMSKIDGCAFAACEELRELVIPKGVQKIGGEAFQGCGLDSFALRSIVSSSSGKVHSIGANI